MSSPALDRAGLERRGYRGFVTFGHLLETRLTDVPDAAGSYIVLREATGHPAFCAVSVGGRHKGRDPSVSVDVLGAKWVDGATLLYVGKAPTNPQGKRGLRTRLREYARFGAGANVGHFGGRYIWQIEESPSLLVAWRVCDGGSTAASDERDLVLKFAQAHDGRMPFANIASLG